MPDAAHLPALSVLVGACRAMVERLREYDSISLCTWDSGVTSYPTIYLTAEVRVGPPCHQGPSDMAGLSSRGFLHAPASACLVSHGNCLPPACRVSLQGRRQLFRVLENLHPPRDPETKSSLSTAIHIGLE